MSDRVLELKSFDWKLNTSRSGIVPQTTQIAACCTSRTHEFPEHLGFGVGFSIMVFSYRSKRIPVPSLVMIALGAVTQPQAARDLQDIPAVQSVI